MNLDNLRRRIEDLEKNRPIDESIDEESEDPLQFTEEEQILVDEASDILAKLDYGAEDLSSLSPEERRKVYDANSIVLRKRAEIEGIKWPIY